MARRAGRGGREAGEAREMRQARAGAAQRRSSRGRRMLGRVAARVVAAGVAVAALAAMSGSVAWAAERARGDDERLDAGLRDAAGAIAASASASMSASPPAEPARASAGAAACTPSWPRWARFKRDFVSADGRVIDVGSADERTVSEGQAYGLFFALVANDRPAFDALLRWTEDHLAQGDLAAHLPAWLWGRAADGALRVLDANAASDADLWIAYALLEAGRLWRERSYTARGALLAKRVLDDETATLPGLGLVLLPGPTGFRPARDAWRLNPSYSPPQAIRGLGAHLPGDARWARLAASVGRVLIDSAPHGFAPDWALYRPDHGFEPDADTHGASAYNAIRVYLWAGMLDADDALARPLAAHFAPFAAHVAAHGAPPETVDAATGAAGPHDGNAGFSAAAVPFLDARGERALADAQVARIARLERETASGYYANVLTLFGLGWRDGRYRFAADGTLRVRWSEPCSMPAR
ncbi:MULTISPECIES: cellulose synthase complex periplasmic endoglucanase BcsZ [unclassified Burkholderia]|uniref:cellulose synthase complex periplasmic endoglucanase BcsZ n=1 Tax=unclassified Burkholderia TaxID=2613784 RepID=UPI0007567B13|nr:MULTISPECIES: cellulose synthase complex periplasmic endoglucanase BcsZ [unclassified Burkholderia]KVN10713.1 endoglucanase [Burkholderia sp. MSMB1552]KWZ50540.1 endoglucanase [Burkholderia sp. MSMB1588]